MYTPKKRLIATAESDGVKTISEILNSLFVTPDINKDYELFLVINGAAVATYNHRSISDTEIDFTNVHVLISSTRFEEIAIKSTASTLYYMDSISSGSTFTDNSSTVMAVGRTYKLYEK